MKDKLLTAARACLRLCHSALQSTFNGLVYLAKNTPDYAYRLFLFIEKLIDIVSIVGGFVFKLIAPPVKLFFTLLLIIFRAFKSLFDWLIFLIILLTEEIILIVEDTPRYAYALFLFTEKLINITSVISGFIFKVIAYPINIVLLMLRYIFRFLKKQFDALIYLIILLTEKIIVIAENTPEHAYQLFLFTGKTLDLLGTIIRFVFTVVSYPIGKIFLLLLIVLRYLKSLFDSALYSIVLLTEDIIVIVENTPGFILRTIIAISHGILNSFRFLKTARAKVKSRLNILILKSKLGLLQFSHKIQHSSLLYKLKQYALLIRLDKPIGILLLLWPTLMALWIAAEGWPDTDVLIVFVAGVFLMRSAGCAINDYADRDIDRLVSRTKDRPITSGKISGKEALVIFALLSLTAFSLVLLMNPLTIVMSVVGLILAASYPFMKRHHYLPQVHLGAAFGWAVPMAYAAQANELSTVTWLLFIATVLWATAYDTMYAMVDRDDDIKIGVKSTAILFEAADTLIIGIIQSLLILCLIMIGQKLELGIYYFSGVLAATGFAVWQQRLIRDRQPAQCFKAFLNNNWFGFALFVGVFLEYQIGDISS